ncbi:MAG: SgcJ/EcaC family oxidoreductase [Deltaproteobacteria bacterium]|nr:MAG: SgcJ/EcaC family oxidoreductase [Deltaproteobacteria bacterium]
MTDNERVIRAFIAAWSRLDPAELASYFREDGVYHNMPMQPVAGRDNIERMIRGFTASWTETRWEIRHVVAEGDVVIAERVDRTRAGDKAVDLPCAGVFEMEAGKIRVWRDYFDLGTYTAALS